MKLLTSLFEWKIGECLSIFFQPVMVVNLCQNTRLYFWDCDQQLLTGLLLHHQHCLKMFIMGQKFEEVFRHISTKRQRACQSAYYSHVKTSKTVLALTDASQFQTQLMYLEVTKYGNTSHTYHVDDQEMWPIKLPFKMRQNKKCIQKTTLFCG